MADNEHVIKVRIDQAEAEAANARQIQQAQAVAAAHDAAAKASGRSHDQVHKNRRQQIADLMTAEQRAGAMQAERLRDSTGKFVAAHKQQGEAAQAAGRATAGGFDMSRTSAAGLVAGIGNISYALSGIGSLSGVVQVMARYFDEARRAADGAAASNRSFRDSLRQLANLEGKATPDTAMLKEQAAFRVQTLQTRSDAIATQEEINNQLGAVTDADGVQKLIAPAEVKKLAVRTGQMQARLNVGAEAIGKLAGMSAMTTGKDRVTGEDAAREMSQSLAIMDKGGSSPTQASDALSQNSSIVMAGQAKNMRELAALTAAFSVGRSATMATDVQAMQRSLSAGVTETAVAPGSKVSQAEYLQGIGIRKGMSIGERSQLLISDMEKAQQERGREFDPTEYLVEKSFGNVHDRAAMTHLFGQRNAYRQTFDPMARQLPTMDANDAKFEAFKADEGGRAKVEEIAAEEEEIQRGVVNERRNIRLRQAHRQLVKEGTVFGGFEDEKANRAVEIRAMENVRVEGIAAGLDWSARTSQVGDREVTVDRFAQKYEKGRGLLSPLLGTWVDDSAVGMSQAEDAIRAAREGNLGPGRLGVSPGPDPMAAVVDQLKGINASNKAIAETNKAMADKEKVPAVLRRPTK